MNKKIRDLEGMVLDTIECGSGLLLVNDKYIDGEEFLSYIERYENKINYSEYIENNKLKMIVDKKTYIIEIA